MSLIVPVAIATSPSCNYWLHLRFEATKLVVYDLITKFIHHYKWEISPQEISPYFRHCTSEVQPMVSHSSLVTMVTNMVLYSMTIAKMKFHIWRWACFLPSGSRFRTMAPASFSSTISRYLESGEARREV